MEGETWKTDMSKLHSLVRDESDYFAESGNGFKMWKNNFSNFCASYRYDTSLIDISILFITF